MSKLPKHCWCIYSPSLTYNSQECKLEDFFLLLWHSMKGQLLVGLNSFLQISILKLRPNIQKTWNLFWTSFGLSRGHEIFRTPSKCARLFEECSRTVGSLVWLGQSMKKSYKNNFHVFLLLSLYIHWISPFYDKLLLTTSP